VLHLAVLAVYAGWAWVIALRLTRKRFKS